MLTAGEGKYRVWLKRIDHGDGTVLLLGGGERTHVGSVVLCEPGKKAMKVSGEGHLDWMVAEPIAEKHAKKTGKSTVCVAGIHVNDASKEEIEKLKDNCRKIKEKI